MENQCKKLFLIRMVIIIWAANLFALPPDTLWTKKIGGSGTDVGMSVQQIADGYIIAGYTNSFGAGSYDVYLIKTNSLGDTLWTKTFGGESADYGRSVQQTSDNGYIIAGYTGSLGYYDIYLIKTDADGDTMWTRIYERSGDEEGYSVQQTFDGGYIVAGNTTSGPNLVNMYLIKTDANGDTMWTKVHAGGFLRECYSVKQTVPDSGYITAGMQQYTGGPPRVCLTKLNSDGVQTWNRYWGGTDPWLWHSGSSVQQTSDNGYIIAGRTGDWFTWDVYLIKTDSDGNTLWTKIFGGVNEDECFSVRQVLWDEGYIIAGYTKSFGAGSKDVYLIRTEPDGDTLWTKTFGGTSSDEARSVQQTFDYGYIIAGTTSSFGERGSDVYLIKTAVDLVGVKENKITDTQISVLEVCPNPFKQMTEISFQIQDARCKMQDISLKIYDITGRIVKTFNLASSFLPLASAISWDGTDKLNRKVSSGVYFVRLKSETSSLTRKVILLR